ncbi:MAG: hypothetical protein R3B06_05170 [Kofleriaceae bacterium]
MSKPTFTPIASTDLDAVTGGAASRTSSSAKFEDRLMDKMTSITTAIKDVAVQQQNKQGNDPMASIMPIIAMKMMRQNR